ncbi:MAG TPA: hypothetical protein VLN59_01210, partial [Burkholderiales bacterium]|nr:hypothetical protein [Burkholderiales bacterium]
MSAIVPVAASAAAWQKVLATYRCSDAAAIHAARARIALTGEQRHRIVENARERAAAVRAASVKSLRAEAFLQRYNLSTREGVVLMCLAEALLRIPDRETADTLIREKLAGGQWMM